MWPDNDLTPTRPATAMNATSKIGRWTFLEHPARTALATVAALIVALLLRLPEPYWAPITTIVITQSSLGAAWEVSKQRFLGTVLGAIVGTVTAVSFGTHHQPELRILAFTLSVFLLGLLCQAARVDRNGYRFGGVTLALVLMIPHTGPVWTIGFHRFAGVTIGIVTALIFAKLWPEPPST